MEIGWNLVIETTHGNVGLWTCWLGNIFEIFYPYGYDVPDELIMKTLGVTYGKPVKNENFGTRKWAKFYSKRLENDLGRVWVDNSQHYMYGRELLFIKNRKLKFFSCGHSFTNSIHTESFTFCSEKEPDAPNASMEVIQPYRDKFVKLLVEVAKLVGEIKAVHLDSGNVLYTPEDLEKMGYKLKKWKEGYTDYCYCKDKDKNKGVEIILKSGNSMVPWITIIRYPTTNDLTAMDIINLVDGFDNSEKPYNLVPLIAYYIEQERIFG